MGFCSFVSVSSLEFMDCGSLCMKFCVDLKGVGIGGSSNKHFVVLGPVMAILGCQFD